MSKQIKSKKRVADFGEVYTAKKQVNAMLDLIPDNMPFDATYLEPACGNGNFLIAIMQRKLEMVFALETDVLHNVIRAVSSVYGVDIQADNVTESVERMMNCINQMYRQHVGFELPSRACKAINNILVLNIICGDTLTGTKNNGEPLIFCEWDVQASGYIICKEFKYNDLLTAGGESDNYIEKHRYNWLVETKQKEERQVA